MTEISTPFFHYVLHYNNHYDRYSILNVNDISLFIIHMTGLLVQRKDFIHQDSAGRCSRHSEAVFMTHYTKNQLDIDRY